MTNLVSVTIENSPKILSYIIDKNIEIGEKLVVEAERGVTIAEVKCIKEIEEEVSNDIPKIIRIASDDDLLFVQNKKELEIEAKKYCKERISFRKMNMKIVNVTYMLHSSKVIFYFTADGRVDFRDLVKDLASHLKSRIEMRQIGVRDLAQMIGGIGVCGRELCCHCFMGDFKPISLDDARQNCSGNSDKLIGVCGRFMCCLKFEGEHDCSKCDCHSLLENKEGLEKNIEADKSNFKAKNKQTTENKTKTYNKNKKFNKNKYKNNKVKTKDFKRGKNE